MIRVEISYGFVATACSFNYSTCINRQPLALAVQALLVLVSSEPADSDFCFVRLVLVQVVQVASAIYVPKPGHCHIVYMPVQFESTVLCQVLVALNSRVCF